MISNSRRYEEEQLNFPQANFPFSMPVAEEDEDEGQYGWRYEDLKLQEPLVFPPRLRLQSRPIHISEHVEEHASSSMRAFLVTEEQKAAPKVSEARQAEIEKKSLLARVVNWFVAPFTPSNDEESVAEEQKWCERRGSQQNVIPPAGVSRQAQEWQSSSIMCNVPARASGDAGNHRREPEKAVENREPIDFPAQELVGLSQMGKRKNRLAGRTTKIRLETVSRPALQVVPRERELDHWIKERESRADARMGFLEAEDWTSMRLPAYRQRVRTNGVTSDELAAVDMYQGHVSAPVRRPLAGHGRFESGQSDVTIANEHITATSIVVVTLTSNPGPVVVHYVSLQPEIGFTVHLTAPTTVPTTFNYVVLLGELF
jgi:hypothetical protein